MDKIVRHHVGRRVALFTPSNAGLENEETVVPTLKGDRTTHAVFTDGSTQQVNDSWKDPMTQHRVLHPLLACTGQVQLLST